MLFILLAPYVALPAFLAFGVRKRHVQRLVAPRKVRTAPGHWASYTCLALGQPAPASYRDLQIHQDGNQSLQALFEVIEQARVSLDVCTFILGQDACGTEVIARLAGRARAGVRVRLLVDGLGLVMGGHASVAPMLAAGGSYTVFMPPLRTLLNRRANLRNHRKSVVADAGHPSGRAWCGGRNLAAEYFVDVEGRRAWHDLTFDLQGPLVLQVAALFERDWTYANRLPVAARPRQVERQAAGSPVAGLVASGPDEGDDTIYSLLLLAAYRAEQRIAIATPYFVPDADLLLALCMAARRGVEVDVLVPERSNHPMSDFVRGRAFRALEDAGARVWLAPGMLHAKLAVFDDTLALAGSANLDSRSLFLNYEMMVAFYDAADVGRFAAWFAREQQPARAFEGQPPGVLRDLLDGMLLWLGFQI
jgi:cardiolipin synthase